MAALTSSPAWKALTQHYQDMHSVHMRDLFAQDPQRFERFSLRFGDILFDYSKNRITDRTMSLLFNLARQANLGEKIEAMFTGQKINVTENRAVLHTAPEAAVTSNRLWPRAESPAGLTKRASSNWPISAGFTSMCR